MGNSQNAGQCAISFSPSVFLLRAWSPGVISHPSSPVQASPVPPVPSCTTPSQGKGNQFFFFPLQRPGMPKHVRAHSVRCRYVMDGDAAGKMRPQRASALFQLVYMPRGRHSRPSRVSIASVHRMSSSSSSHRNADLWGGKAGRSGCNSGPINAKRILCNVYIDCSVRVRLGF